MGDIRSYLRASPPATAGNEDPDYMSCPFCQFRHHDFGRLQAHVQASHSDHIDPPPADNISSGNGNRANLSDMELAQLLAFEEAGIPAELALEDFQKDKPDSAPPNSSTNDDLWIDCFCGERILLQEIDIHSSMHQLEIQDGDDVEDGPALEPVTPGGPVSASTDHSPTEDPAKANSAPHHFHARRLGRSELGPYAYEKRMPKWLHVMLSNNVGGRIEEVCIGNREYEYAALQNETSLLVPKLQLLSRADSIVLRSAFCSPVVNHVSKLLNEGGFCGYRNIQMMISYLRGCHLADTARTFKGRLPTIFELQNDIETAWDSGLHAVGRVETGGIKDTRKYIGTAEAMALFMLKKVRCHTEAFSSTDQLAACDAMLESVKQYFTRQRGSNPPAPIYLQYKGHSMTIVGFEEVASPITADQAVETNLIIFDPMFRIATGLKKLSVRSTKPETKLHFLKAHRYPRQRFKRFDQFELLFLDG